MTVPDTEGGRISLDEASRQLELAVHDARVAFDCIGLGELDRAHTHAITARAAADAAENVLRAALGGADLAVDPGADEADGAASAQPDKAFEAFAPRAEEVFDAEAPQAP